MINYKFNTVSNYISLLRVFLVIPLVWSYFENVFFDYASFLMLFAAVTDFADGYFARKFNQISEFGKFIDPLADKIFVFILVLVFYLDNRISSFYFYLIILRDVFIFLGGIYVTKKLKYILPSNLIGKMTVTFIGFYLLFLSFGLNNFITDSFYIISIILVFVSFGGYVYRAIELLKWKNKYEII